MIRWAKGGKRAPSTLILEKAVLYVGLKQGGGDEEAPWDSGNVGVRRAFGRSGGRQDAFEQLRRRKRGEGLAHREPGRGSRGFNLQREKRIVTSKEAAALLYRGGPVVAGEGQTW